MKILKWFKGAHHRRKNRWERVRERVKGIEDRGRKAGIPEIITREKDMKLLLSILSLKS